MHRLARQPPCKLGLQFIGRRVAIGGKFLQALHGDRSQPADVRHIDTEFSTQSPTQSRHGCGLLLTDDPRRNNDRLAPYVIGEVAGEEFV